MAAPPHVRRGAHSSVCRLRATIQTTQPQAALYIYAALYFPNVKYILTIHIIVFQFWCNKMHSSGDTGGEK